MTDHYDESSELAADAMIEYVSVRIGDQLFGAPVNSIREVFAPQSVTAVPLAPLEVAGLLNLRGRIVTAIDARRRLGLPPRPEGANCMALGMEHGTELFGILVDEVGEVVRLKADTLEVVPAHLDSRWRAVLTGVHRLDNELLAALDMKKLIAAGNAALAA